MIVVGIDGSKTSREALRFALHEATLRGTRVRVVHAWSSLSHLPLSGPGVITPVDPGSMRELAESTLRSVVESVAGERAGEVERVLVAGSASDAILEHAHDAELIVVGSRGLGAVAGLLLGSVSKQVLHQARSPVVVIPRLDD